ncbi:MAG: glycosyltransferase [Ghiorsea sp.]|nr:glycosyltransferase [Ghiorsea sp.]
MTVHIVVANRLIKIFGAIIKTLSYPFHALLPNFRFTIPEYSAAKCKSKQQQKIPKVIWQTNFTNQASFPVYINYLFNRLMSLSYDYRYVSTEARLEYLEANASPEIVTAYKQLTNGAAQADLWRMFVLWKEGGVYMDIDAHLVWPLAWLIKPEDDELFLVNKQHYTNYLIAAAPNHPILKETIDIIVDNIQNRRVDQGVYYLTGPVTFNTAIGDKEVNSRFYRVTCIQGSFTNEHFQYIDRPRSKWTHVANEDLLK